MTGSQVLGSVCGGIAGVTPLCGALWGGQAGCCPPMHITTDLGHQKPLGYRVERQGFARLFEQLGKEGGDQLLAVLPGIQQSEAIGAVIAELARQLDRRRSRLWVATAKGAKRRCTESAEV